MVGKEYRCAVSSRIDGLTMPAAARNERKRDRSMDLGSDLGIDAVFRAHIDWLCLMGSVQIAHSLLLLSQHVDQPRYIEVASALNAFVRRTVTIDGDPDVTGGVKGSAPVNGPTDNMNN